MMGLDPLTVGSLLVLASSGGCTPPKPAEINVRPKTAEVEIIKKYTLGELQNVKTDTISPHSFSGVSVTQGFMAGRISMIPRVKLDYSQNKYNGTVCIWYDTIDIEIAIDPKIYIGKEVYYNQCQRKATLDHEMKHVHVDRQIVNKYAAIMGQKVFDTLKQRGFAAGPVPGARAQDAANEMQNTVIRLVEHEYKKMGLERMDLQRAVDSKEEYDRVDALCPDPLTVPDSLKAYFKDKYGQ